MSGGLFALLDDIAVLAKAAAASVDDVTAAASRASVKAAGVIVDDAAVTPRYVTGLDPARELPIIKTIAIGSLRNKLLLILPVALLLSQFLPWALTPILMVGGAYLCYEGAEKLWEKFGGQGHDAAATAHQAGQPADEKTITGGAIRTDFILSAEIMVISLNEVAQESLLRRAVILVIVAIAITAVVYGAVALIVKMDDVGLHLAKTRTGAIKSFGTGLVNAMPRVLTILSVVGVAAMLWVGGYIILSGLKSLGVTLHQSWMKAPYTWLADLAGSVADGAGPLGGVLGWCTSTVGSAIIGIFVGAVIVAIAHFAPRGRSAPSGAH